jgi:hypothetical protein
MISTVRRLIEVLESIDRHLHIIARATEARALSEKAYATDKQCFTKPSKHVRRTMMGTHTGPLKEELPQCDLNDFS